MCLTQAVELTEQSKKEIKIRSGFLPNSRRGTGHIFSAAALEHFLRMNDFSHAIRAHELQDYGASVRVLQ